MYPAFMIRFAWTCFFSLLLTTVSLSQNVNHRVFDGKGNAATLEQIVAAAGASDVVFLGENHDDAVAHALQLELFKRIVEAHNQRKIALSLEMFESDVQIVLDEYLADLIPETHFLQGARPWKNYATDYKPLVELAKQKRLPVIAANAPRRYVNMVTRNGRAALNQLSPLAKSWLAPLPYGEPSKAYADKFVALMQERAHQNPNLLQSQALWDATMAYFIAEGLKKTPGSLIVHLNGSFHSENRLGTVEHLLHYKPNVRVLVVTMRPEENFAVFDKNKMENIGDFVILTDAKAPKNKAQ
jgi:uncharacterized iron-regulated protein